MADEKMRQSEKIDITSWKPGSEPEKARKVADGGDFGVPVGDGPSPDRQYVSANTRASDPGATNPYDWENDARRDHGVGGRDAGPGSSSAGDIDLDIIGFGTGGGLASSPPGKPAGPDDSDGSSNEFASHLPPNDQGVAQIIPARGDQGSTESSSRGVRPIVSADIDAPGDNFGQGADAATNPSARADDSFAGEISSGEARGEDEPLDPASHENSDDDA